MDLRNYFSAKPKPKAASAPAAEPEPEKKRTSARKKTIIHDSDEDDEQDEVVLVKSKHFAAATPSKPAPAKKEIVEEPVDPKAFFASSKAKKSQPATTTTSTTRSVSAPSPSKPVEKEAKKESVKETKASVEPAKPQPPGKRTKKANDDDYFSDDSEVEVLPQPKSRTAPPARTKVETPASPPPSNKRAAAAISSPKKRRGSTNDDYEDDEDDEVVSKPTKRQKSTPKKPKEDDAMDVDEPEEKPKAKFNFWAHKNKAGPSALGSKEIPKGEDNCLASLTFVFTGELSSITREDATDLVKRYSGRVTGSPSGKTSYVVVGDDAGQSKLDKVKKLKIKTLDEDEFLDLIRTSPARTEDGEIIKSKPKATAKTTTTSSSSSTKVKAEAVETKSSSSSSKAAVSEPPTVKSVKSESKAPVIDDNKPAETELWTSKYRPKQIKDLCGNNAGVQKLVRWLENWDDNYKLDFKKDNADKSGTFRAVLISGPPGVGKTSAAHLVGESLGYNIVEFNASDTRSKKSLDADVRDLLDNQSLGGYFLSGNNSQGKGKEVDHKAPSMAKKQLIIMDEVDGMAGGDRGGVAQMIAFIKKTQVPIICICNDRQSPKVRSLVNSCFDMRFQRPQVNQVRSRLLSILHREGRQIPANVLDKLVSGSQSDIRQVLNMLSTWSLTKQTMDYDEGTALSKASEKYVALNPFQIAEQLLVNSNYRALSFADKFDTYFNDYQLAPLMIQENYVRMNPAESGGSPDSLETMELMSKAADSLSDADLVDSMIHGSAQHWSLMNTHAAFSCVRPAFFVHGNMRPGSGGNYGPMMQFPSYLGQYSKSAKYSRLVKEVQIRMRLKISGDKNEVRQNYIPALFPALTRPLIGEGVDAVPGLIEFMDEYYLSKEDWDTILELGIGRNDAKAVLDKIPTQVKTAFTRKYNSTSHPQPYLKATVVTKGRGSNGGGGGSEESPDNLDVVEPDVEVPEEVDQAAEDAEEESVEKDKNIKQKKAKGAAAKGKATAKSSSASKGKATTSSRSRN